MFSGLMLLLGLSLVGIFLVVLHSQHGPGSYDD